MIAICVQPILSKLSPARATKQNQTSRSIMQLTFFGVADAAEK